MFPPILNSHDSAHGSRRPYGLKGQCGELGGYHDVSHQRPEVRHLVAAPSQKEQNRPLPVGHRESASFSTPIGEKLKPVAHALGTHGGSNTQDAAQLLADREAPLRS